VAYEDSIHDTLIGHDRYYRGLYRDYTKIPEMKGFLTADSIEKA
jgi:hypothetical protein